LSPADADDLAQDLWEWLIRTRVPTAVIASPWLKAAVHNYILRFKRRSYWRQAREGRALETIPEPQSSQSLLALESSALLDRILVCLPERERSLLALIRQGHTIAEAARMLGIPKGSRAYYQGRIVDSARREAQRRAPTIRRATEHDSGRNVLLPGSAGAKAALR
jgi:DNA-directed RNA polymerase specialized sigma24 family protein